MQNEMPAPTVLTLLVTLTIAGRDARIIAEKCEQLFPDGNFDPGLLALMRAELGDLPDDWWIVHATLAPAGARGGT